MPLWQEHEVIGRMLEHNLAAIRYPDYHIFAGCYPNDVATQEAVQIGGRDDFRRSIWRCARIPARPPRPTA